MELKISYCVYLTAPPRNCHMQGIITADFGVCPAFPCVKGFNQRTAFVRDGKVDDHSGSSCYSSLKGRKLIFSSGENADFFPPSPTILIHWKAKTHWRVPLSKVWTCKMIVEINFASFEKAVLKQAFRRIVRKFSDWRRSFHTCTKSYEKLGDECDIDASLSFPQHVGSLRKKSIRRPWPAWEMLPWSLRSWRKKACVTGKYWGADTKWKRTDSVWKPTLKIPKLLSNAKFYFFFPLKDLC